MKTLYPKLIGKDDVFSIELSKRPLFLYGAEQTFKLNKKMICLLIRYSFPTVFLTYALLTIALTWPLMLHLNDTIFGDYGDARGEMWRTWARLQGLLSQSRTDLLGYPFGVQTNLGFSQPVTDGFSYIFGRLFGEIVAHNLFALTGFILTAFSTFYCTLKLTNYLPGAFLSGIIFGFSPAAVMQAAGGHSSLAFNIFMPFVVLMLFKNRARRNGYTAVQLAIALSLVLFTAIYFGYFCLYIIALFCIFDFITARPRDRKAIWWNYFLSGSLTILIVMPFFYQRILLQIKSIAAGAITPVSWRPFDELTTFSARVLEYFLPSTEHPMLGRFTYEKLYHNLHGSNIHEHVLYLGCVPLTILIAGLLRGFFLKKLPRESHFYFLASTFALLIFLSFRPLLPIFDKFMPTVSYFAYDIFPMFRVYSRAAIIAMLFLAICVALVLKWFQINFPGNRMRVVVTAIFILVIFEFWSIPWNYAARIDRFPPVYEWLANEDKNVVVAEYPMMHSDDLSAYTYLFWQRKHRKRLVNGASQYDPVAWAFHEKIRNIGDPATTKELKKIGVTYLIVHANMYHAGTIPKPIQKFFVRHIPDRSYNFGDLPALPSAMKLYKQFGDDYVFKL